jgi:serine phosphatase RsbU (regulator of sigma subunit)/tetratricopeptide (TPR) repeat protein
MTRTAFIIYIILFVIFTKDANCQSEKDSLYNAIENAKEDTSKYNTIYQLASLLVKEGNIDDAFKVMNQGLALSINLNEFQKQGKMEFLIAHTLGKKNNLDSALHHFNKCFSLLKKSKDFELLCKAKRFLGTHYQRKSSFIEAEECFLQAKKIAQQNSNSKGEVDNIAKLGLNAYYQSDYVLATSRYLKALQIYTSMEDSIGLATVMANLAQVKIEMGSYEEGINLSKDAVSMFGAEINLKTKGALLNNIGAAYNTLEGWDSCSFYYSQSMEIFKELGAKRELGTAYKNLGKVFMESNSLDSSILYYRKSIEIRESIGDRFGLSSTMRSFSTVFRLMGRYQESIEYGTKAFDIAKEIGDQSGQLKAARQVCQAYAAINNHKKAYYFLNLSMHLADTVAGESIRDEIVKQEIENEYKMLSFADSLTNVETKKRHLLQLKAEQAISKQNKLEADKQKQQSYFLYGGLCLALLFGLFIFNRFKVTNKQKGIIENQKGQVDKAFHELEEKNTEIMDSINYAKRIQSAILPTSKVVKEYLQESFILYKPKDIVAGDFYWLEHKEGKVLFAAADCTGHGVPGAMVSVICNNGLNRSVREHGLSDPGKILDKTREIVISEFEKSEDEVKDGMDIALCSLTLRESQGPLLEYAGAHNPLWIIRDGEVLETKANKQPIGQFDKQTPYTTHSFELQKGDSIYIFSDGYVDQFGGEKGKKFKSKGFRNLLLSIQDKSMEEQRTLIDKAFEAWRGSLEQIDDVCVIGVRV